MSLREDIERTDATEAVEDARGENPVRPRSVAAAVPAPVPSAPPAAKPRRPLRRTVLALLLCAALGGGAYAGWQWWTVGRFFVSTDDAYVQADISVLAAKVPGYLAAVPVVNGQAVKAGDVIARIDDGDNNIMNEK